MNTNIRGNKKMKITGKIWKNGNSYAIRIPKGLVDAEIIEENTEYILELRKKSSGERIWSSDLVDVKKH